MASNKRVLEHPTLGAVHIEQKRGARSLRLRVAGHQRLTLTAPLGASTKTIKAFLDKSHDWVVQQKTWSTPAFENGTALTSQHILQLMPTGVAQPQHHWSEETLSVQLPLHLDAHACEVQNYIYDAVTKKLRALAKSHLVPRARQLAAEYQTDIATIRIKNSVSRWGSYSSNRNLNLNLQLMRLNEHLRDHVIVHELCHAQEMSHSKEFWNLFEKRRPQAKAERTRLREYQLWRKPC